MGGNERGGSDEVSEVGATCAWTVREENEGDTPTGYTTPMPSI